MNAYELAEKLEYDYWHAKANITMFKSASMLRQQADRIAELEKATGFAGYCNGMMVFEDKSPQIKELSDRELVVFLMDEIDRASEWLVDGETHMAIGVLGQCHAKIRKHLSNTKES